MRLRTRNEVAVPRRLTPSRTPLKDEKEVLEVALVHCSTVMTLPTGMHALSFREKSEVKRPVGSYWARRSSCARGREVRRKEGVLIKCG
mgnify:CR=1 FL=1|jgi:hypothetical protein